MANNTEVHGKPLMGKESVDTAGVFNLCFEEYSALPVEVQILVQKTFTQYLKTLYATALQSSDEDKMRPFGLAIHIIDTLLALPGRVHAQSSNEAIINISQEGEILDSLGKAQMNIRALPPRDGHSPAAKKMMEAVLGMIKEIETQATRIVVPKL